MLTAMEFAKQIERCSPRTGDFRYILADEWSAAVGRVVSGSAPGWVYTDGTPVRQFSNTWTLVSDELEVLLGFVKVGAGVFLMLPSQTTNRGQRQKRPLTRLILALVTRNCLQSAGFVLLAWIRRFKL